MEEVEYSNETKCKTNLECGIDSNEYLCGLRISRSEAVGVSCTIMAMVDDEENIQTLARARPSLQPIFATRQSIVRYPYRVPHSYHSRQ